MKVITPLLFAAVWFGFTACGSNSVTELFEGSGGESSSDDSASNPQVSDQSESGLQKVRVTLSLAQLTLTKSDSDKDSDEASPTRDGEADDDEAVENSGNNSDLIEDPEDSELGACAEFFGKDNEVVVVNGNQQTVDLTSNSILLVKIAGNRGTVNLSLEGLTEEQTPLSLTEDDGATDEDGVSDDANKQGSSTDNNASPGDQKADGSEPESVEDSADQLASGACIFVTGNQGTANISYVNFKAQGTGIVARGNQASANLTVDEQSDAGTIMADLSGNKPELNITGAGQWSCPEGTVAGNDARISCE